MVDPGLLAQIRVTMADMARSIQLVSGVGSVEAADLVVGEAEKVREAFRARQEDGEGVGS